MNDVETFGLAIKVVGVARLVFLFQVEGRLGIVLGRDRQDGLQLAGDLRISRSKKLHMMPAPIQPLTEVVDDALGSAMCPRWNGDINAGDLSDLHDGAPDPFYTCKIVRQVLVVTITTPGVLPTRDSLFEGILRQ